MLKGCPTLLAQAHPGVAGSDDPMNLLSIPLPIRDHFLSWQCRLRQEAIRRQGGRPSPGMRPRVVREDGGLIAAVITVLIVLKDPAASADAFRHIVRRTHDPCERYQAGLGALASAYYQHPENFSDVLTALFPADSEVAATLVAEARCVLDFQQHGQGYSIPCVVSELPEDDPAYQATCWHNYLFNPALPPAIRVLAFSPDWAAATVKAVTSPES